MPGNPGYVLRDPTQIVQKIRRFQNEVKVYPQIAKKLLSARRFSRWLVNVSGSRIYIAPVRYAMWSNASIKQLQHAESGETDSIGFTEESRIVEIYGDDLYFRADKAIRKLTGRGDNFSIFVPRQRYLYSNDRGTLSLKRWDSHGRRPSKARQTSPDSAVVEETKVRFLPSSVRVLEDIVAQGPEKCFRRNDHLALCYCPDGEESKSIYVFVPRTVTVGNLHAVVRSVLAEALEYRYRYLADFPGIAFVAAFSTPVSEENNEVVKLLNHYKIFVIERDAENGRMHLVGSLTRKVRSELPWLIE